MLDRKINIIIWGCNPFSKALYEFIQTRNINVIAFINDNPHQIIFFCEKQVFTPAEFKKLNVYCDCPIVIANDRVMFFKRPLLRLKYITQFKEKLQEITHLHQIQNKLLHPSSLIDFLFLRVQHKPILFGLQGAGNVLFNQLFLRLCKVQLPLKITRDKRTFFFEMLSREYLQIIKQIITDHIHLHDGHTVHHIAWKIGTSHFNCIFGKNRMPCSIYTFNTRNHFAELTTMYHQIPSVKFLHHLQSMRFKTFFIMRNPLDMILSGINKTGGINKENSEINMQHFYGTASWVINQLNAWLALSKYLHVLRYEDLLKFPIKTINAMMKQLHLWPAPFLAKIIWDKTKFKQLPHAFKHHFWQGGFGKWEQFFKREHLIILKALGIEKVLLDYQYSDVYAKFKMLTANLSSEEILVSLRTENKKNTFYRDEQYDTFQFLQEMHGDENCVRGGELTFVCHDHETLQHLSGIFNSTYLNKIILSGTYDRYR